jgi:hypothetical protein
MKKPTIKLRDVLALLDTSDPLPDEWLEGWADIRNNNSTDVSIRFMCEEETWIKTYSGHPILIPWYDCEVEALHTEDDFSIGIWLKYEDFLRQMLGREKGDQTA